MDNCRILYANTCFENENSDAGMSVISFRIPKEMQQNQKFMKQIHIIQQSKNASSEYFRIFMTGMKALQENAIPIPIPSNISSKTAEWLQHEDTQKILGHWLYLLFENDKEVRYLGHDQVKEKEGVKEKNSIDTFDENTLLLLEGITGET